MTAQVASLVTLNAGVAVSIEKVNITIADVDAELELVVRLGKLQGVPSVFDGPVSWPELHTASSQHHTSMV